MNEPKLRFKADDGNQFPSWDEKKLGDICTPLTYGMNVAAIKYDGLNKYIRITDIDDESHLYKSDEYVSPNGVLDDRYLVGENDILFARTGASVGKSYIYNKKDGKLYYAGFLIKAHVKSENSNFVFYQTLTERYAKWVQLTSMRSGQPGINANEYSEFGIQIPCLQEQQKIASLFTELDDLIQSAEKELEGYRELKHGMLQKMFPKKGEKVPKIRFPEFTSDWEQCKLGEITIYRNGTGHEEKQSESGKYELINLNSISIDGGLKPSGKFIDEETETLLKDDLVMVLSDVGHGDLLGRVALIPENNRFVLNQRVALLRNKGSVDIQYLFSYINAHQIYFKKEGAGSSQLNISRGSVENFDVLLPHKDEQKKIGSYFANLDNLIQSAEKELDGYKELKKGLLQQMFC